MKKKIAVLAIMFCLFFVLAAESVFAQSVSRRRSSPNANITVTCNVPSATLYVDGTMVVRGGALDKDWGFPFSQTIAKGNHTFKVTAAGYEDLVQTVNIQSNQTVTLTMKPQMASINIDLKNILSSAYNAKNQVTVLLDGSTQSGTNFRVSAGKHTITIKSGGILIEQEFDFKPGQTYKIEPSFELKIR